ncbi:MAG TPA: Nif3-like dinuclear metal center hexameric protein, partial [Candidatus Methanoperedens sp.]|nr:Nif3-like dinuclear metal center hexameric protein [Candidatus Methanoperedens sp.]
AAPPALALPDDNPGLQIGSAAAPVRGILVALDPTPRAVQRARAVGADLLVTHHPLFLEGLRRIDTGTAAGAAAAAALGAGIAVFAAHTNLDAAPGGLAVEAARRLRLRDVRFLHVVAGPARVKVVVFTPGAAAERVRAALAAAGAGSIGAYDSCAFTASGEGAFRPRAGARPAIGRVGRLERVPERRIEVIAEEAVLPAVLAAARRAHPYEAPAIDCYPLRPEPLGGFGCVGEIAAAGLGAFVRRARAAFGAEARVSGRRPARVRRVAVCPGSGGRLVPLAAAAGADVFVTGEVRYHNQREAEHHGLAIVELGHDRTEMPAVGLLARLIREGLAAAGARVPVATYREPQAARAAAGR